MTDENKAAQPGLEKLVADIVTLCNMAANSTWSISNDSTGTQAAAEFGRLQQDVLSRIRDLYAAKAARRPFECWSDNDGDSWGEHPADGEFVDELKVGDEYELLAGWNSVRATYRVTKAPDDESDDYEVECVSHPEENAAPAQPESKDAEGMPAAQEPKYGIRDDRLYNRASGEFIPVDEPIFIFRAKDVHAINVLSNYARTVIDAGHEKAVWDRVDDFKRFWNEHAGRMKQPDTAIAASIQAKGE